MRPFQISIGTYFCGRHPNPRKLIPAKINPIKVVPMTNIEFNNRMWKTQAFLFIGISSNSLFFLKLRYLKTFQKPNYIRHFGRIFSKLDSDLVFIFEDSSQDFQIFSKSLTVILKCLHTMAQAARIPSDMIFCIKIYFGDARSLMEGGHHVPPGFHQTKKARVEQG